MTADIRRLVKTLWRCSKYPSLYARQRNHKTKTKKNGVPMPWRLHFTPVQCLPPKPLVTQWCMWILVGDI